jgi:hypothetical protein
MAVNVVSMSTAPPEALVRLGTVAEFREGVSPIGRFSAGQFNPMNLCLGGAPGAACAHEVSHLPPALQMSGRVHAVAVRLEHLSGSDLLRSSARYPPVHLDQRRVGTASFGALGPAAFKRAEAELVVNIDLVQFRLP